MASTNIFVSFFILEEMIYSFTVEYDVSYRIFTDDFHFIEGFPFCS